MSTTTVKPDSMDPVIQEAFTTAFSWILNSVGAVANALSLSYLIQITNKSLGDRILILLNSLDLSVCLLTLIDVIVRTWIIDQQFVVIEPKTIEAILDSILYFVFTESTALATCLLSVTRAISLSFPFYSVNEKVVKFGTVLSFVYIILKQGTLLGLQLSFHSKDKVDEGEEFYADISKIITFITLIILVVIVLISNSLTGYKLLFCRDEAIIQGTNTRRAGITVFILSSLFIVTNILYIAVGGIMIVFSEELPELKETDPKVLLMQAVMQFSVPINSACNPIVYFCRKANMRAYIKRKFRWCSLPRGNRRKEQSNSPGRISACVSHI